MTSLSRDDAPQIRLFTLEEANALLPAIEPTLKSLRELKEQFDTATIEIDRFTPAMRGNGHGTDVLALERRIAELIARLSDGIDEVTAHGVEIKDLNHGLIDFPSLREGRVVYLCWRLGEDQIAYWHDLDAGFAGRQPI